MTTNAKHTPGPWAASAAKRLDNEGWEVLSFAGEAVARYSDVAIYDSCSIFHGLTKADAYLIAAAPELLAACQAALDWNGNLGGVDVHISRQLKAAIAKATGGEP